jgi:hypothetical protein
MDCFGSTQTKYMQSSTVLLHMQLFSYQSKVSEIIGGEGGGGGGGAAFAPWQLMTCILNDATSTHPHLSIAHI